MINSLNYDYSIEELTEFLDSDPRVFSLQKKMYITHSGAFNGKIFSISLTPKEFEKKVLVPGDRCIPFVDGEIISSMLRFDFSGKRLSRKLIELDKSSALDLFALFGEEYSVQYLASDPACQNLHIAENDFELPPKLNLTGVDLSPLLDGLDFKITDRILCRVTDWSRGMLELFPFIEKKENPYSISEANFARQKWNEILEKALLESFEIMGPCASIEEQLSNVFYEHSRELCVSNSGSVHEFLRWTKKVGIEYFGVESRLWRKGEEIPAVGKWNMDSCANLYGNSMLFTSRPSCMVDSFIKDQCFEKKNDISALIEKIIPDNGMISEKERKKIALQIENRNKAVRKNYNLFADFSIGRIRHAALNLYLEVELFMSEIDCNCDEFRELPQQEMVTLSQLFTHLSRIIEITTSDIDCKDDETYAMQLSVEGMEENFQEIKPMILAAMRNVRKKRFNVI